MQARAAAFAHDQVMPAIDAWERDGLYPRAAVAASGLTGLFCPEAIGGAALSYPDGMAVFEELGRGDAALAFSLSMHNAVAAAVAGHPDLGERWGRALAGEADLVLVVCKTSAEPGHRDIAIVAVERAAAGVSFPVIYRKACAAFLPIGEMELDGAPAALLAPPGAGMRAALGAIDVARCDIAAIAAGLHAEALDTAVAYASERQAFGAPILDLDAIRLPLADVATELEASRLLYRQAAERLGTPDGPLAVAHAKRFCPDAALRAAIACSEVLGAYGWLLDHPLARMIALAKMLQVVDGTAEIQRVVIGRSLASSRSPRG